jgi:hypothetical protein
MNIKIDWPSGKDFAFTIFDDPDFDTIETTTSLYSFLKDLGYRTTKAVWPLQGNGTPKLGGTTCENERYLELVLNLKKDGFEIAFHNATHHTSTREQTAHGLETFRRLFGHDPALMANHVGCQEGIYWGSARVSSLYRLLHHILNLTVNGTPTVSQGHIEGSPLFWGDLCQEKIKYVRNFVFGDINTLKACPVMPYYDPTRPFVNQWFAASEGPNVTSFNAMVCEQNQDRLVSERGACIMYTHLAAGFLEKDGKINKRFMILMDRMSKLNGWFVPVSTLLDFILQTRGSHVITQAERSSLERRWIWHKIAHTQGRS